MTLKTDANSLAREVRASHEQLLRSKDTWSEILASYHGRSWDGSNVSGQEPQYQTHTYEYLSLMLPKLVHANPRFSLSTTRGGRQAVITRALERGLNHWATASRLHEPLEQIAIDALMMCGGGFVEEIPNQRMRLTDEQRSQMQGSLRRPRSVSGDEPEDAEQPMWPRLRRLEPFRWGWDVAATSDARIRFYWHKCTEDKNDLLKKGAREDGLWRTDAIKAMPTQRDQEELGYAHNAAPDRDQVTYYVVWVPDARIEGQEPEADEHGVIYTMSCEVVSGGGVDGSFIRDPYYFYGPAQGPYVKAGFYAVPSSTFPLSPILATRDMAEMLTRVRKANVRGIEKYRRKTLFDLKDKKDLDRIEAEEDQDLVGVTGFDGNAASFELGGMSDKGLEGELYLRELLQTASGMDDVQRGNVTGTGTATEVAIASEGSQERVSFVVGKWRQFVADVAMRVAWYAAHDDHIIFTYKVDEDQREAVAEEALGTGQMDPGDAEAFMRYGSMTYAGGDFAKDAEGSDELLFGDLDFDVEPYSMQRRDQRTRKMDTLEALNVLSSFGAAAMQGVPIDFGKIAEILADVYALPELEDVVNKPLAEAQGVLSMQEREAAMAADTAKGQGESGGQAKPERSARPAAPKKPEGQTMKRNF
jgi:hypothetical protein